MKKMPTRTRIIAIGLLTILFSACSKQKDLDPPVSNSIYGTYAYSYKQNQTGSWTDLLSGTIIKVKPLSASHITITTWEVMSQVPALYDSVLLGPNNTFSIDRYVPNTYPDSTRDSLQHLTGTGSFSDRKISLQFTSIIRTNPLLHSPVSVKDATKTSDNYN